MLVQEWQGSDWLGECPVWHPEEKALYWLDCFRPALYRLDPVSRDVTTWVLPAACGSIAPKADGGLVAFMGHGFATIDTQTGAVTLCRSMFDLASGFRCNDGKCDPRGRFWAGTVTSDFNQGLGQLYRWNLDGSVDVMVEGLYISNGLGWSPDQRWMYLSDSYLGEIYRFAYDAETGDISNRTLWLKYDGPGVPDGLTVDSEGYIWTAVWDGQCVLRLNPEGEVVETIDMPVQRPTSCILGGDNLQTLYITSSSRDITDPDQLILPPPNGGLYSMSVSVSGLPENMARVNVRSCTV